MKYIIKVKSTGRFYRDHGYGTGTRSEANAFSLKEIKSRHIRHALEERGGLHNRRLRVLIPVGE